MGLLDTAKDIYKEKVPLHLRTFAESVMGNTDPITNETLGDKNLQRTADAIRSARAYRQGLLDLKAKDYPMSDRLQQQYDKLFPDEDAIKHFQSGGGTVSYDDHTNAEDSQGRQPLKYSSIDFDLSDDASVMNTLGQFAYKTNPDGTISIIDQYDFINDVNFLGRKLMGDRKRDVDITLSPDYNVNLTEDQRQNVLRNLIKQIEMEQYMKEYEEAGR